MYKMTYITPDDFDNIIMESDGDYLTRLEFTNEEVICCNKEAFSEVVKWLDIYFSGVKPIFTPKFKVVDVSNFCLSVIDEIKDISFGELLTYGDIAKSIAKKRGIKRMSSQAVGGALHRNPICLILPCHRVIGKNGSLTGYGGGINNKLNLLKLEGSYKDSMSLPKE